MCGALCRKLAGIFCLCLLLCCCQPTPVAEEVDTPVPPMSASLYPIINVHNAVDKAFVSFSCVGGGEEDGIDFHYTLDGSEPTEESSVFDGKFIVSNDLVVSVVSVSGGVKSPVVTREIGGLRCYSPVMYCEDADGSIKISCATPGAAVYYSEDKDAGFGEWQLYEGSPLVPGDGVRMYARAVKEGVADSGISSYLYDSGISVSMIDSDSDYETGNYYESKSCVRIKMPDEFGEGIRSFYTVDGTFPSTDSSEIKAGESVDITQPCVFRMVSSKDTEEGAVYSSLYERKYHKLVFRFPDGQEDSKIVADGYGVTVNDFPSPRTLLGDDFEVLWKTEAGTDVSDFTVGGDNEDVILFCMQPPVSFGYEVVFHRNSSNGDTKTYTQQFMYGELQSLTKISDMTDFSNSGNDFSHWATDATGMSVTRYTNGQPVLNLCAKGAGSGTPHLDLYAIWVPQTPAGEYMDVIYHNGRKESVQITETGGKKHFTVKTYGNDSSSSKQSYQVYFVFSNPTDSDLQTPKMSYKYVDRSTNNGSLEMPAANPILDSGSFTITPSSYQGRTVDWEVGEKFFSKTVAEQEMTVRHKRTVDTLYGEKTLYIVVKDDLWGSLINQKIVDEIADTFLKEGEMNDIYDLDTAVFGEDWSLKRSSERHPYTGQIALVICDLTRFGAAGISVAGTGCGITEFFITSSIGAKGADGYDTIAHELQHVIYRNMKDDGPADDTWFWSEVFSTATPMIIGDRLCSERREKRDFQPKGRIYKLGDYSRHNGSISDGLDAVFFPIGKFDMSGKNRGTYESSSKYAYGFAPLVGLYLLNNYGIGFFRRFLGGEYICSNEGVMQCIRENYRGGSSYDLGNFLQDFAVGMLISGYSGHSAPYKYYEEGDVSQVITLNERKYLLQVPSVNLQHYLGTDFYLHNKAAYSGCYQESYNISILTSPFANQDVAANNNLSRPRCGVYGGLLPVAWNNRASESRKAFAKSNVISLANDGTCCVGTNKDGSDKYDTKAFANGYSIYKKDYEFTFEDDLDPNLKMCVVVIPTNDCQDLTF